MLKRLINFIRPKTSPPTPVQATPRQQQESRDNQWPDMGNLPHGCTPIDTVLNTTRIPGTNLEIGTAARAVETNRQERIEFNKRHGLRAGCGHPLFSIDQLGGTCFCCEFESLQLLSQGLISRSQAEERSLYCVQCASYCINCFRRICASHTRLYQCPDGRFIPLCLVCHEQLTHKSLLGKIISLITGK
jgi:hypothetical protein